MTETGITGAAGADGIRCPGAVGVEQPVNLLQLRTANIDRDQEWDADDALDLSFFTIEFAGEAGELCNKIKKVLRERAGLKGSRVTHEELLTEFGDVLICLDLVAMKMGLSLNDAVRFAFNRKSEEHGFATRL